MQKIYSWAMSLALTVCLGPAAALAAPHISDFALGISRQEASLRSTSPCGDKMCGDVVFGGKSWSGSLVFHGDTLFAIILSGPLEREYMDAAFQGYAESPYVVYTAVSDGLCFDFVQKAREGSTPEQLDVEFAEFLSALRATGESFATYFYTEPAVYEAVRRTPAGQGGPCGPQPVEGLPGGIASCLAIAQDGITVMIMTWSDLQHELALRTAGASAPQTEDAGQAAEQGSETLP